jgi:hypothetical protein
MKKIIRIIYVSMFMTMLLISSAIGAKACEKNEVLIDIIYVTNSSTPGWVYQVEVCGNTAGDTIYRIIDAY